MKISYIYILSSKKNGVLYIGVTNNIARRVFEHKSGLVKGFTWRYNISNLVYYEVHEEIEYAILREKQMKVWKRQWKINLIEKDNPQWNDLYSML